MRELNSIQERILDKTLYLIGITGSFNVPVRSIVKEASVNVSAINYYFGNKDNLLNEVKEFYIENTLSAYQIVDNTALPPEERLIIASNEIMEYAIRYPGILVILKEARKNRSLNPLDEKILNITENLNLKLVSLLGDILNTSEEDLSFKNTVFMSSLLYPLLNREPVGYRNTDLSNRDKRIKYIKMLLKQLKVGK
ncbi:MAG: TetR/AcrR family transcriptional regulator [Clostridiaceae bacterium]